ncbi:MAG TPA: aminotransferase class IV [Candidatus Acidoferrales bacterium]|nr:aminotransferase class IV [Candidatus Acidoferrales bacterium]
MIHRLIFHNDRIVPVDEARLSPGQAGLLNGWGLFTTMRIFQGEAFAYERHWRRLEKDAARIRLPFSFDPDKVRRDLGELLSANQVVEGTARIYLINNRVGFWLGGEAMPEVDLILCTAGLPAYSGEARLGVAEHGRHAASPLAGVKTTAWLNNVWHLAEAQKSGWSEVILLNERREVAECTSANIFCVKNGAIFTPPLSSGCLEGVTRSVLLEIAPRAGVPLSEKTLMLEDLYAADEVFITSTNRSLLGVSEISGRRYSTVSGPLVQKLERAFEAAMREYVAARGSTVRA